MKLCSSDQNYTTAPLRLSAKTQLYKIEQSGVYLGRLLGPLLKTGLPLMKNLLKPLAKSVLIPSGLTASRSAIDKAVSFLDQV